LKGSARICAEPASALRARRARGHQRPTLPLPPIGRRRHEDGRRARVEHTNQYSDCKCGQHDGDPGGAAAFEAPRNRQQDQLCRNRRSPAPTLAQENAACHDKQQQTKTGHQNRHADSDHSTRHPDLPDLEPCVRQSDEPLKRQQGGCNDDGERPLCWSRCSCHRMCFGAIGGGTTG
jgi:hypothetical protein